MTSTVAAEKLTRVLPGVRPVTLISDIDLRAGPGEMVAITGPSGSDKSSLLYLLGLLDVPTSGRVLLDGAETYALDDTALTRLRLAKIGFVFQHHFLLAEFSVLDNVLMPMRKRALLTDAEMRTRAETLLADLGLGDATDKFAHQLSAGERQRVAIARALANDPILILADEPTGNLDSRNSKIVLDIFLQLATEQGKTVIAVTHNLDLAASCSRSIRLVDGRIESDERNSH
jgi:lipoprotein-releasing system ATP-binding protein